MLAKCQYTGAASNQTCNAYIGAITSTTKYANNAISALDTLGSTSSIPKVNTGGLFTQIASYPSSHLAAAQLLPVARAGSPACAAKAWIQKP